MSYHEYKASQEIEAQQQPFYGLVMACMRQADDRNLEKLGTIFPDILAELRQRYNAPGGRLDDEPAPSSFFGDGDSVQGSGVPVE